jgi:nicotinamidase-related amidase
MSEIMLDTKKTAYIVVDMQKHFVNSREGFLAALYDIVRSDHIIENTVKLMAACRKSGIHVFHITVAHKSDRSDVVPTLIDENLSNMPVLPEGSNDAQIIDELKPLPGEDIIIKRRHGAFYNTELELLLRAREIDTVLVSGVLTDACVANTVWQAWERDFNVILVSDCCATRTRERHIYWIKNIFPRTSRVRNTEEVVKAINPK